METTRGKLLCGIDINICGLALCIKEENGPIKKWIMLYMDTNNANTVGKILREFFTFHKLQPDIFIIEKIYFKQITNITKLLAAEGIARGVVATLFPAAECLLVPSVSYKTYFQLSKGNHKNNKQAAVEYCANELADHFGKQIMKDERVHDLADTLLLCKFVEATKASDVKSN
jgi:Holliday junction resolvasome RuvABC endonuclease subunit